MKRLLVVDDEKPVVEGISLIVRRDLRDEFEVAGSASSGREAIEKADLLAPDIVLMDVRMPGISGLEAIRELRARGSKAVFILVTAYERFDIAREAVGLGVLDYLLKPVSKDKLAAALRSAASTVERKAELERREMDGREAAQRWRGLAETALFHAVMAGAGLGPDLPLVRSALGLPEGPFLVGAAYLLPHRSSEDPQGDIARAYADFLSFLGYKTSCLGGPVAGGRAAFLLPLREATDPAEARDGFLEAFRAALPAEAEEGLVRIGFSSPVELEDAASGWREACRSALLFGGQGDPGVLAAQGGHGAPGSHADAPCEPPAQPKPFEDEESLLLELFAGEGERARVHLERILARLPPGSQAGVSFWLLASLFGEAARGLARRGLLSLSEAEAFIDAGDLRQEASTGHLAEAARERFDHLLGRMGRSPRRSPPVAKAIAFIRENYGRQIGLELAADAAGLTPGRLSRLFVEETGKGFSDYLIEYRIEKAREALREPGASIKNVSLACGYPDPNYFSRLFKKVTGFTPTSFSSGLADPPYGEPAGPVQPQAEPGEASPGGASGVDGRFQD